MIGNQIKGLQEFKEKLEGVTTYGQLQDLFKDIPAELVDSVSFISGNTGELKSKIDEILNSKLGEAKAIYSDVTLLNNQIRQAQMQRAVTSEVYTDNISPQVARIMKNVRDLDKQIDTSDSLKTTMDIHAKIDVQIAMLKTLSVQGDLLRQKKANNAKIEIIQQQAGRQIVASETPPTFPRETGTPTTFPSDGNKSGSDLMEKLAKDALKSGVDAGIETIANGGNFDDFTGKFGDNLKENTSNTFAELSEYNRKTPTGTIVADNGDYIPNSYTGVGVIDSMRGKTFTELSETQRTILINLLTGPETRKHILTRALGRKLRNSDINLGKLLSNNCAYFQNKTIKNGAKLNDSTNKVINILTGSSDKASLAVDMLSGRADKIALKILKEEIKKSLEIDDLLPKLKYNPVMDGMLRGDIINNCSS